MRLLFAAFSGGLFGAGLMVSGMTDPARVQGWLDVFGAWDPTLGFVLTGAIVPMILAWAWVRPRHAKGQVSISGRTYPDDPGSSVDMRLVGGSALFGIGWGLAGLCPGPSMAVLAFAGWPFVAFFAAMVAGMVAAKHMRG